MSDESSLSFSEEVDVAKKNGNPTGSDDSYVSSSPDQENNFGEKYRHTTAPGKIRGRRGKAKRMLGPQELDGKRLLANSQERDRMDKLNFALENLRDHLPDASLPHNRRMSKIRTLTVARNYIADLSRMIYEHDTSVGVMHETSSCLYAPRDDVNRFYVPDERPMQPVVNPRVPDFYSYDTLGEQTYPEPAFYPSFIQHRGGRTNLKMADIIQYQSPKPNGYFPESLARAIRTDIMARPINEVTSFEFNSSTPLSSRTHPYDRS